MYSFLRILPFLSLCICLSLLFSVSVSCDAFFLGSVQGILFGGLSSWRAVFCVCVFLVSVDGSPFSSLPDGLRHFYGDHNPYSILHIPYSMLYVIYDLEGSNTVNPQVRNLFHVGKNLFTVLFGSIKPPASLGNGHSSSNQNERRLTVQTHVLVHRAQALANQGGCHLFWL